MSGNEQFRVLRYKRIGVRRRRRIGGKARPGDGRFAEHLRQGTAVVPLQLLSEYFVAATRKLGLAAEVVQRKLAVIARARIVRVNEEDVIAAIELHRQDFE